MSNSESSRDGSLISEMERLLASLNRSGPEYHELYRRGETKKLEDILRSDPRFHEFDETMRTIGDGASRVTFSALAQWLVLRSREVGTSQTLRELDDYRVAQDFPVRFVVAVGGVEVDNDADLGNGVALRPFTESDFTSGRNFPHGRANDYFPRATKLITAAFETIFRHPKLHGDDTAPLDSAGVALAREAYCRLSDARLCLGLVRPSASVEIGRTILLGGAIPAAGPFASMSNLLYAVWPDPVSFGESDLEEAKELNTAFARLPAELRNSLRIPLNRLQSAMVQYFPTVEAVIDLGIALEALFLTDNEKDELTFRLSVRGARLLGHDTADRKKIRTILSAFYGVRSVAVHRGVLPRKVKHDGGAKGLFDAALGLACRGLKVLIQRGRVDWDDVLLGQ